MILTINKKDYELKTNLRVVKGIQGAFKGKPFIKIVEEIENLSLEELIKILMCGISDTDKETKEELEEAIYDNWGLADIYDNVKKFIMLIQYPGLTDEEIEEKAEKNIKEYKKLQEAGLKK